MSVFAATGELQRIPISVGSSGDNTVVAAVDGYCIRVIELYAEGASAVTLTVNSDIGGGATALSGPIALSATKAFNPNPFDGGLMQTAVGKALNLSLSGAVNIGGFLVYQLVLP